MIQSVLSAYPTEGIGQNQERRIKLNKLRVICLMQNERYYVVGQIETAFFELLREKDYTDITVTDIIKKA